MLRPCDRLQLEADYWLPAQVVLEPGENRHLYFYRRWGQ